MSKKAFTLIVALIPMHISAQTCPGNDMPDTIEAVYVKYKVTDELYIRLNREWGAPATVVGDEVEELILWKDYHWKRLYGKNWSIDTEHETKMYENDIDKLEAMIERQQKGEEVPLEEGDRVAREALNRKKKHKVFEYDQIDVETPAYSLYYNRANQVGYGVLGRRLTKSDRSRMDNNTRSQVDNWLSNNFKDTNRTFGFEKLSTRKSRILGHDVICETVKTSFKDFQRNYNQIEFCKAIIKGFEVDLYQKAGEPGQQYIMQAVEVSTDHPVRKHLFCAPDYVKLRTP